MSVQQPFDSTNITAAIVPGVFTSFYEFVLFGSAETISFDLVNGSDASGPVVCQLWARTALGANPTLIVGHSELAQSVQSNVEGASVQSLYPVQIGSDVNFNGVEIPPMYSILFYARSLAAGGVQHIQVRGTMQ
jgi:hypothetical protein